ncbi:hypothetical protein HYV22_03165 [Candidatus Gottesmanbacteria bacterium]|nr:hypothetical protein [Candidatus Gottesmanbacteria bacterium]
MPEATILIDQRVPTGLNIGGVFGQPTEPSELGQKVARYIYLDLEVKRLRAQHLAALEREQELLKRELKPLTEATPERRLETDGGTLFIQDRDVAPIAARTDHMLKYVPVAS